MLRPPLTRVLSPLLSLLLGLLLSLPCQAQTLHLASNEQAEEQKIAALLLQDIYQRLGMSIDIEPVPGLRAHALAISGEKDGEVARVQAYANKTPALIQVTPAYYYLESVAFARRDKNILLKKGDSLRKYRIGIVRGITHAEMAAANLPQISVVSSYTQLYQMLANDRIDLAIDTQMNGEQTLRKLGLNTIEPVLTLEHMPLFHMLNRKHAALAEKLGAQIKRMKDSGELEKLSRQYEAQFAQGPAR